VMTTPIAQMSVEMAKVSIAMQKGTKATQVLKVAQVKLLQTALGPVYDLFLDMKLAVAGVIAVFKPFNRVTTQTGETMLVLQGPLGFILKAFTDIRLVGLFLMSILLSLGAVMSVTGSSTLSFGSAFETVKAGFDFFIEVISSAISYIQSFDFEPIISAFALLFDYLIDIAPLAFDKLGAGIDMIGGAFIAIQPQIQEVINFIGASIVVVGTTLLDLYKVILSFDFSPLTNAFTLLFDSLIEIAPIAFGFVIDGVEKVGDGFAAMQPIIQDVIDFIGASLIVAGSKLKDFVKVIQSIDFSPVVASVAELVSFVLAQIPSLISVIVGLLATLGNAISSLKPFILTYIDLWIIGFTSMTSFLIDFYTALIDAGVFTAVIGLVYSYLEAWEYVFDGVKDGFKAAGISGDGFGKTIKNSLSGLMSYIEASGILELSARFINALGKVLVIWGKVLGAVLKWLIIIVVYISGPLIMAVKGSLEIIFVAFKTVIEVITELLEGDLKGAFVALLSGIIEIATIAFNTFMDIGAWALSQIVMALGYLWDAFVGFFTDLGISAYNAAYSMWDTFTGFISGIIDYIWGIPDALMQAISDAIDALTDFDLSGAIGGVLDIDVLGGLGFSGGGIAKGPTSGYPVTLHGTEAVVPLPDGKTIPVALQGAMPRGGDNVSFNINVSGSKGDPKEVAKLVGKEVQRAFRTRSRSGGYGRGI
jgi:hypothetical protein